MKKILLALSASLMLTTAFSTAFAQNVSDAERLKIEAIVRDYIAKNPEIITDALTAMERKQAEIEEKARAELVAKSKDLLVNPKLNVVLGNPKGDVTLVEFFDYNCGFCKRGYTDVQSIMKADSKLRVIQMDFPVLGQGSMEAARVALAVKMQATPAQFLTFHEKVLMGRGQANTDKAMNAAKETGLDMARLEADLKKEIIGETIRENLKLGDSLKISGTPSYVVGEEVIVGAVGEATLKTRIESSRKSGK